MTAVNCQGQGTILAKVEEVPGSFKVPSINISRRRQAAERENENLSALLPNVGWGLESGLEITVECECAI